MSTRQKTLNDGATWIATLDPTKQDFQATVVISKTLASGATDETSVYMEYTLSSYEEIAAGTAVWVEFLDDALVTEFVSDSDVAIPTNVGKPVTALRSTAIGGPVTVQVLQAGV